MGQHAEEDVDTQTANRPPCILFTDWQKQK